MFAVLNMLYPPAIVPAIAQNYPNPTVYLFFSMWGNTLFFIFFVFFGPSLQVIFLFICLEGLYHITIYCFIYLIPLWTMSINAYLDCRTDDYLSKFKLAGGLPHQNYHLSFGCHCHISVHHVSEILYEILYESSIYLVEDKFWP